MRVGLVGYDQSVEALVLLCKQTKTKLTFWTPEDAPDMPGKLPAGVKRAKSLDELTSSCQLIFFCSAPGIARSVARALGERVRANHVIVHTSRALEPGSSTLLSQVLREETATHRIGFLTGPFRTDEIRAQKSSAATLYSRFPEVHGLAQDVLVSPAFRLYRSTDLVGAQLAASYARVIAFVHGVALGMEQGAGVSATLFARGLAEISRVVLANHGEERTVFGMSGAGNLFVDVQPHTESDEVKIGRRCVALGSFDVATLNEEFGSDAPERFAALVREMNHTCETCGVVSNIGEAALAMVEGRLGTREAAMHLMTLPVLDE